MTDAMIEVNGHPEPLEVDKLEAVLSSRRIGGDSQGVAVALNGRVVPREQWGATRIEKGDRIEIVRALRGG